MQSTLILNASYEPLSIVSGRRAIQLVLAGKARSVDDSPVVFKSAGDEINVPYVIILNKMRKTRARRTVPFSKKGVLVRDAFTCVYCQKPATTIDHVYPQTLGGKSTYDNCVASCQPCNSRKDSKLIEELGWKMPRITSDPTWYMIAYYRSPRNVEGVKVWSDYLAAWDVRVALAA